MIGSEFVESLLLLSLGVVVCVCHVALFHNRRETLVQLMENVHFGLVVDVGRLGEIVLKVGQTLLVRHEIAVVFARCLLPLSTRVLHKTNGHLQYLGLFQLLKACLVPCIRHQILEIIETLVYAIATLLLHTSLGKLAVLHGHVEHT